MTTRLKWLIPTVLAISVLNNLNFPSTGLTLLKTSVDDSRQRQRGRGAAVADMKVTTAGLSHTHLEGLRSDYDATEATNDTGPTFVFVVGLEGTGHHALSDILRNSPSMRRLRDAGIGPSMKALEKSLFSNGTGLMDAYCSGTDNDTNAQRALAQTARLLERISTNVRLKPFTMPENIAINANGINRMMSFPMGRFRCSGRMRTPSLGRLYEACDAAKVRCLHLYIHRDPHALVHSTTVKRRYNPTIFAALHTYTTMLEVIYAQMAAHATRTAGCLNIIAPDGEADEEVQRLRESPVLRQLGGWTENKTKLIENHLRSVYRPPLSMTDAERLALVPHVTFGPYLRSMIRAHENVLGLCPRTKAKLRLVQ